MTLRLCPSSYSSEFRRGTIYATTSVLGSGILISSLVYKLHNYVAWSYRYSIQLLNPARHIYPEIFSEVGAALY